MLKKVLLSVLVAGILSACGSTNDNVSPLPSSISVQLPSKVLAKDSGATAFEKAPNLTNKTIDVSIGGADGKDYYNTTSYSTYGLAVNSKNEYDTAMVNPLPEANKTPNGYVLKPEAGKTSVTYKGPAIILAGGLPVTTNNILTLNLNFNNGKFKDGSGSVPITTYSNNTYSFKKNTHTIENVHFQDIEHGLTADIINENNRSLKGSLKASFYGPQAQELIGDFKIPDEKVIGVFGAKKQ